MQVVILCGGQGTRAYPYTQRVPKALLEVAGVAIVEHVMRIYAAQGFQEFLLACGYLKEAIMTHFDKPGGDWEVRCFDTGDDSDTGERLYRLRDYLQPTFMATYCDGLADIDLHALLAYHRRHERDATVTATPLRSQYGIIYADEGGRVTGFAEKPVLRDHWINGGFFVFERSVFEGWSGRNLEREILPELARRDALRMYRHTGFWRSMDTYKDQQELNTLWAPYAERLQSRPLKTAP